MSVKIHFFLHKLSQKKSVKANWRILIFCILGTKGLNLQLLALYCYQDAPWGPSAYRDFILVAVLPKVGGGELLLDEGRGAKDDGAPRAELAAAGVVHGQVGVDHVVLRQAYR